MAPAAWLLQGAQASSSSVEEIRENKQRHFQRQPGVAKGRATGPKRQRGEGGDEDEAELDDTGESLMMLALGTEARGRLHEGAILTTCLIPRDHRLVLAVERAGAKYAKKVQEGGEDLGPPHLTKCLAAIEVLCEINDIAMKDEVEHMKYFRDMMMQSSLQDAGWYMRAFLVKPTFDKPGATKLDRVSFRLEGFRIVGDKIVYFGLVMYHLLQHIGAQGKVGGPPAGDAERRVRHSLNILLKGKGKAR